MFLCFLLILLHCFYRIFDLTIVNCDLRTGSTSRSTTFLSVNEITIALVRARLIGVVFVSISENARLIGFVKVFNEIFVCELRTSIRTTDLPLFTR